jgi:hypothetical protein
MLRYTVKLQRSIAFEFSDVMLASDPVGCSDMQLVVHRCNEGANMLRTAAVEMLE